MQRVITGEHWLSVKRFPFLQTDDWWFTAPNSSYPDGILVASNSYFLIKGKCTNRLSRSSAWALPPLKLK